MKRESSSFPLLVAVAVVLVIGLVLYPLSTGPAVVLLERGYVDLDAAQRFYYPLGLATDACPPLNEALVYWQSFFERRTPEWEMVR